MRHGHTIAVGRIDPHVVVVANGRNAAFQIHARLAAVDRLGEFGGEEVPLAVVVGRDGEAGVVVRPPAQPSIRAHQIPVLASVVASPERAALRFLSLVRRHAVARFDERVDAVRVAPRDLRRDLADRRFRQTMFGEPFPGEALVSRAEKSASRPAAEPAPGVDLELPHARENNPRIAGIHRHIRAAGVLVDKQRAHPRLAAIGRAEDAALLLRTVGVPQRAGNDDVGIFRIDHDSADASGLLETRASPCLASVGRLVDPVSNRDVAADECLAGARPNDVRIGGRDGQRANRRDILVVEDRVPVRTVVGRLEDAARRRACVIDVRTAGDSGDGNNPVADRSDVAKLQLLVGIGRERRVGGLCHDKPHRGCDC